MIDFPANPTIGQEFTDGGNTWTWDGVKWTTAAIPLTYPLNPNSIINGNFIVNERNFGSGTPLAANEYGLDRWKAGAGGCTCTFAAAIPDQIVTITAGTLLQIIEQLNTPGGVCTLSWDGTAQARVYYSGSPIGAYAQSPIVTPSLVGANTAVEFNTGTVTRVKFEQGPVATPFNRDPISKILADCQRYFIRLLRLYVYGYAGAAGLNILNCYTLPVHMAGTPSVLAYNISYGGTTPPPSGLAPSTLTNSVINLFIIAGAVGMANCLYDLTVDVDL